MQFLVNIWNAQRNAGLAFDYQCFYEASRDAEEATNRANKLLRTENAALRSQINQRGAGGKFTKKSPAE